MMTELEIGRMSDRDLLVQAVTMLNAQGEKMDAVCKRQEDYEKRLTTIETEHKTLTCQNPQAGLTRKQQIGSAATGGGIVGAVLIVVEFLIKSYSG
jgi:hypothetical protein